MLHYHNHHAIKFYINRDIYMFLHCICNLDVPVVISYLPKLDLLFILLESRGYTNPRYQELVPFTQGSVQQHDQVLPFIYHACTVSMFM